MNSSQQLQSEINSIRYPINWGVNTGFTDWLPEETICNQKEIKSEIIVDRVKQLSTVQEEGLDLFRRKNQDYGDAFSQYGVVGVLVRLGDKIARCQNITTKGVTLVDDEKLRDTLIDLHNYAGMAVMLLDESKK